MMAGGFLELTLCPSDGTGVQMLSFEYVNKRKLETKPRSSTCMIFGLKRTQVSILNMLCARTQCLKNANATRRIAARLVLARAKTERVSPIFPKSAASMFEDTIIATSNVTLKPVIDILKSIDARLERIETRSVKSPPGEYVHMVDLDKE